MGLKYPKDFGTIIKDLSPQEKDPKKKSLYVIETDTNQRDFSAPPKTYGVFWSADGPKPVNEIAIGLWSVFCGANPRGRDFEDNIDGSSTREGECYQGFACLNYGSVSLSINVSKIESTHDMAIYRLHDLGLLEGALELQGIKIDNLGEIVEQMNTPPWLRGNNVNMAPLLEVLGADADAPQDAAKPAATVDSEVQKMEQLMKNILKWRPEKRGVSRVGKQFVVLKFLYPKPSKKPMKQTWIRRCTFEVHGPGWKDDSSKDGFLTRKDAVKYAREEIRDKTELFEGYIARCPENASSDGPWNTEEMDDSGETDYGREDRYCRIEVVTKEEFACFLHNHLVKIDCLRAPLYMSPPGPQLSFEIHVKEGKPEVEKVERKLSEEERKQAGKQYIVAKMTYPAGTRTYTKREFAARMDIDCYGPNWVNENDEGFATKEEAIRFAKNIRDQNDFFTDYVTECAEEAASNGPWDSADLRNDDNDEECRIEIMTREEFACFMHNQMVNMRRIDAPLIPSPPAPPDFY